GDRRLAAQALSGREDGEALARRYDRPRDFVVDRLLLWVPQLPEPADGPDDADGEPNLDDPDESAERGLAHVGVLACGLVTDLEAEDHHRDRLASGAPEVAEVGDARHEADDAGHAGGLQENNGAAAIDQRMTDHADKAR